LVRLSTALGGQSELGVRWLNALAGVTSVFLVYEVGRAIFSRRAGAFAAAVLAVSAPYVITSRFVYTDGLHLCLLLLNLYCFWRLVDAPALSCRASIAFGVSLAMLFNTKYSAYLYASALAVAVLLDHRRLLFDRRIWIGVLLGMLGLLPVVAWNAVHEWVSFRWQLSHAALYTSGYRSLSNDFRHAAAYLTWPLLALALAGLGRVRRPAERLLTLVALFLLVPVAFSQADSPRNWTSGLVLLVLVTGARMPSALRGWRERATAALLTAGALAAAIYGMGSLVNLFRVSPWPHSSVVSEIRQDAGGWRVLGPALAAQRAPIFALDYSIASQVQYYADRPAYTAWGQYRIWGIPDLNEATIVTLGYLSESIVTSRLRQAFREVDGPRYLRYTERELSKQLSLWQAQGMRVDQETFLQTFDFLTLLKASR
jgi:4-amino-4-deoxy-L-arabinose transferase-like glycosyltransferase